MDITTINPVEYDDVLVLWEGSVRATHNFLTDADIALLRPIVRDEALPNLALRGIRNDNGKILGFIGVAGESVEALFIAPDAFGSGLGSMLMQYAEKEFGATTVDVNEQNQKALGFYEHLGYKVVGRSPLDGQGRPFPILHMEKHGKKSD